MVLPALALVVALADGPAPAPPREIYFRPQHTALFGMSMTLGLLTSVPQLNPRQPRRWATPSRFDQRARDVIKASTEPGEVNTGAAISSDILGLIVPPVALIGTTVAWGYNAGVGRRARTRLILQDLAVVFEAWGLATATSNVVKVSVGRQRPFAWAGAQETPAVVTPYNDDKDQNASFPSGHAVSASSIAVGGATIATMRRYPHWQLAWFGLVPAVGVSFLRMAADQHYLSDVLVGTAIGAAYGAAVPLLIHNPRLRKKKSRISVGPFRRGLQVSGAW